MKCLHFHCHCDSRSFVSRVAAKTLQLSALAVLFLCLPSTPGMAGSFQDFLQEDRNAFEAWKTGQTKTDTEPESQAIPLFRSGNTPRTKTVQYSGTADYDGCNATLELKFNGKNVSGKMVKTGVEKPGIRLTTTRLSFPEVPLSGDWEAEGTSISARWTGGDYIGGKLLTTPDYPTNGTLYIRLEEVNGKKAIRLDRMAPSHTFGYIFGAKGKVWTLDEAADDEIQSTGYLNPVGTWKGSANLLIYNQNLSYSLETVFFKNGKLTVQILKDGKTETTHGKWKRKGDCVEIVMDDEDAETALLKFQGANHIAYHDQWGRIDLYRKSAEDTDSNEDVVTEVDPETATITGIALSESVMYVEPGKEYPLPAVMVTVEGQDVPAKADGLKPKWKGFKHVDIADNRSLVVSKNAVAEETKGNISVTVKIQGKEYRATCNVIVLDKPPKLGSITFTVVLGGTPPIALPDILGGTLWIKGPGINKTIPFKGKTVTIDKLPKGEYYIEVIEVNLPPLPTGYVSSKRRCFNYTSIPSSDHPDSWESDSGATWGVRLEADTAYRLHGIVTFNGKPVDNIGVTLQNDHGAWTFYTDSKGLYSIDTRTLKSGTYRVTAEKRMSNNQQWISDGDIVYPLENPPISVTLPLSAAGKKIDIQCLKRIETPNATHIDPGVQQDADNLMNDTKGR